MTPGKIHIGTSGWSYEHWKGPFYPKDIPNERMLEHYARHFQTVEINNSFYHLPKKQTLTQWTQYVPHSFIFSAKASRYITHMKKLKDPKASIKNFFDHIAALDDRLGPILFQLPPHWQYNPQRFKEFLGALSKDFRYSFEFRDQSWINQETLELLNQHKAAFCIYELDGYLSPQETTTDFIYIRLHGPDGPYQGNYTRRTLTRWREKMEAWTRIGLNVFCYFDNDQNGYAATNALRLQEFLANDIRTRLSNHSPTLT